jgi:arylformamidase
MSFIQPQLRLSAEEVQRVSPILHIRTSAVPLVVAWGAAETNEFQRQSKDFLTAWQATGNAGEALAIPEANHFEVLDGFMTADGLMTRRLDALRQRVEAG